MFQALAQFAAQHQVLVFTHHQHLVDIATRTLPAGAVRVHTLQAGRWRYAARRSTTAPE